MKKEATAPFYQLKLAAAIAAGQTGHVLSLGTATLTPKGQKAANKRIDADEDFVRNGEIITTGSGHTVVGFSFWDRTLATTVNGYTCRHRILALCREKKCRLYAIPISKVGKAYILPDIELADWELDAYLRIADRISEAPEEYECIVRHPAKSAIKAQRADWRGAINGDELAAMLEKHGDWIIPAITSALDVQLRSLGLSTEIPVFFYNFTAKKPDLQVDRAFVDVLTAANLSVHGETCNSVPAEIIVQDNSDLEDWAGCHDRVVLLRTSTGSPLRPLFDQADSRARQDAFGGILPPRLPTVPIIRSKTYFCRNDTVDVDLPASMDKLTEEELDLLRTAVARTLNKVNAEAVCEEWSSRMRSRHAYRLNAFQVWCSAIDRVFLRSNFRGQGDAEAKAYTSLEASQAAQLEAETERTRIIAAALDLLGDPKRYEGEIISKPATKADADNMLDHDQTAVAFWYAPAKGNARGHRFLVFSRASMLRLLQRVDLKEELFDAFMRQAESSGLVAKKYYAVTLGGGSFSGIWVNAEK